MSEITSLGPLLGLAVELLGEVSTLTLKLVGVFLLKLLDSILRTITLLVVVVVLVLALGELLLGASVVIASSSLA